MDEPPILSQPNDPRDDGGEVNPFAASAVVEYQRPPGATTLTAAYWALLIVVLLLFIAGTVMFGLPLPGLVATVAAAVRVPLLQKRQAREFPERVPANPFLLLLTSWVFMLVAGFASGIAFVVVCLPTSMVVLSAGSPEDVAFAFVLGLSGIVWLLTYLFLFRLSLRLPF